jgi:hypothetical protein
MAGSDMKGEQDAAHENNRNMNNMRYCVTAGRDLFDCDQY